MALYVTDSYPVKMSATSTISGDFLHIDAQYFQHFSQYRENLYASAGPGTRE